MTTNRINYISADSGSILVHLEDRYLGGDVARASEPAKLARLLAWFGLADRVMHSSTMDFASEEGFADDDAAWALWDAALEDYKWLNSLDPADPRHW